MKTTQNMVVVVGTVSEVHNPVGHISHSSGEDQRAYKLVAVASCLKHNAASGR